VNLTTRKDSADRSGQLAGLPPKDKFQVMKLKVDLYSRLWHYMMANGYLQALTALSLRRNIRCPVPAHYRMLTRG
jgi:hypothetical protein